MYDKIIYKCDVTCSLSSVTNCHTFSDPLPLERDVLYGRPLLEDYDKLHILNVSDVIRISKWLFDPNSKIPT